MLLPPNRSIRISKFEEVEGDAVEARTKWISTFTGRDWAVGAEVFKKTENSSVIRSMVLSRDLVLKTCRVGGVKGLVQGLVSSSRAHRQWAGSEWLRSVGVAAPRCVAIIRGTRDGSPVETLATEYVPGHTLLWQIARGVVKDDADSPASRAIAYAVGRDIAQIIKSGRFNRDHKPSNLVVTDAGPPIAKIATVDAVAIQPLKPEDRAEGIAKMVAALIMEPKGTGNPMPASMLRRIVDALAHEMVGPGNAETWTGDMLTRANRLVEAHGDSTPEHDPLIGTH